MSLRDEVEALTMRDNQMSAHHVGPHRVQKGELHPALVDHEKLSKSRGAYGARAVVEHFHAGLEARPMRPLDEPAADTTHRTRRWDVTAPTLLASNGVELKKVALDSRGIVEIICTATDFTYDLPVYIVNPPLLVEDPLGTIQVVVGEDEFGAPITQNYREDPTQAMIDILADLKEGDA